MKLNGQGSLFFIRDRQQDLKFGEGPNEVRLLSGDGVPVSVTLNLDQNGELLELDFFKADSSKFVVYPTPHQVERVASRKREDINFLKRPSS